MTAKANPSGLEGTVVADTRMSDVDGEKGRLVLAGHDVEALAGRVSFEEICGLFLDGKLPDAKRTAELRDAIGQGRMAAFERLPSLGGALKLPNAMDALRASVAQLDMQPGKERPLEVIGAIAVFAAAWSRLRNGQAPIAPDAGLPHATDLLRMVRGEAPDALAKGLDTYLVTVSDHGMNASTFTARVIASTGSDLVSAVVGAIGALKGPLHGGAPGPVLDMLDAIGKPERAKGWIEGELEAGRRIMGMGHRIYRVRDPRAAVLEKAVEKLEQADVRSGRLPLARAAEKTAEQVLRARHPDRPLAANVEFYTAVLLEAVGLPRELFSATFACGRVVGWCAHVDEQRKTGRLIRPASRYVGELPQA